MYVRTYVRSYVYRQQFSKDEKVSTIWSKVTIIDINAFKIFSSIAFREWVKETFEIRSGYVHSPTRASVFGLNFGIPGHFSHFIWIRIETIVVYLVVQSTPEYVNDVAGYGEVAPEFVSCIVAKIWFSMRVRCLGWGGGGGEARSPQNIFLMIVEMPLEMSLEELLVV